MTVLTCGQLHLQADRFSLITRVAQVDELLKSYNQRLRAATNKADKAAIVSEGWGAYKTVIRIVQSRLKSHRCAVPRQQRGGIRP